MGRRVEPSFGIGSGRHINNSLVRPLQSEVMTKISDNSSFQSLVNDANSREQIENILRMFNSGLDSNIRELSQKTKGISS
jgi:hypothetical protein